MPDILHISDDYVVSIKPIGVSSESDMPQLLSEAIGGDIFCVHRLDNTVGGVMVFARNRSAAAHLSKQIAEHCFLKKYLAVIEGTRQSRAVVIPICFLRIHQRIKAMLSNA